MTPGRPGPHDDSTTDEELRAHGYRCQVAYLPGLAMRRIADLYPGEAKTDAPTTRP